MNSSTGRAVTTAARIRPWRRPCAQRRPSYLLPDPHDVGDALVWARGDLEAVADELWVDEPTLRARIDARHLRPAERGIIVARVNALEAGA